MTARSDRLLTARSDRLAATRTAWIVALAVTSACGASKPTSLVDKPPAPKTERPTGHVCDTVATLSSAPEPLDATTAQVVRVEVRHAKSPTELCAAIQSKAGAQVSDRSVAADIHRIWDTGKVDDVVAVREKTAGGVILAYEVEELERFTSARIDGIASAGIGSAEDYLPPPGPLDVVALHEVVRKVERALADQGFRHVSTKTRTEAKDDGGVELVFDVDLGTRSLVRNITFGGVDTARSGELTRLLVTHAGAPLMAEALERDVLVVTSYYYDHGHLAVHVHPPKLSESGDAIDVAMEVDEGPVYKVGTVRFVGDLLDRESDYKKRFWSTPEHGIFNRSVIAADVERVREYHRSQGFGAEVEPETDVKADKKIVDMTLRLKKR